jgi:hypothetical protein
MIAPFSRAVFVRSSDKNGTLPFLDRLGELAHRLGEPICAFASRSACDTIRA